MRSVRKALRFVRPRARVFVELARARLASVEEKPGDGAAKRKRKRR